MRIAVIGIGGTGSAAARHLAKAGHEVVGYERFRLGHDRGSSHGESRIIRYTYPDLLYTQMMGAAYPLWADLEAEAGEELFVRCGGLYFGPEDSPQVITTERALLDTGLPYERLGPEATQERFPAFRLRPGDIAVYQAESGFLRATRCVLANARLARQHGAVIREETVVQEVAEQNGRVLVRTEAGETTAFDRAIVTAGAWMDTLFARLRLPLRVTRQQIAYLHIARNPAHFQSGAFPVWIDAATNYYGFPSDGRIAGVKIALHYHGDAVSPDQVDREVEADYLRQIAAYAEARLPDLGGETTHSQVCLYTTTPDEHFLLDQVPDAPNVWLVSGCSGHGFKFTVLLGQIAAELAVGAHYPRDLTRFSLRRFAGQDPAGMVYRNRL